MNPDFTQPWTTFVKKALEKIGGKLIFKCNYNINTLPIIGGCTPFWKECMESWASVTEDFYGEFNQIIWNNKHIKIGGMSIYYPEFVEHGIMRISDLYMENGIIPWRELAHSELSPIFKLKWIGILHAIPENLKNIDDYIDDVCMNISGIATPIEDNHKTQTKVRTHRQKIYQTKH